MMGENIFEPEKATIVSVVKLTQQEKLFKIQLDSGKDLDHTPGQFVELLIPGYGEAPISISSSPTKKGPFELCVRAVGKVTNQLHRMGEGDKVGIRGPFGNGFDVEFLEGKNLLFIGGGLGIAPLRSLINYVKDRSENYGESKILYGCNEPSARLFVDEFRTWRQCEEFKCEETVDTCPVDADWEGNVGVITELIPEADFDPDTTYAIVCGPPIMYKFVMEKLDEAGLPADQRFLSLERRMKCGVGECGHCQIGEYYVCRDGPVFNYAEIKDEVEAL